MSHVERRRALRLLPKSLDGLLGSIGLLLSSNVAVAILSLGTLALTSHALTPAEVGLLLLIEAYGRMFDVALRLEPTQALIRLAMPFRDTPEAPPFQRLVRFGILLDVGGAIFATAVALVCIPFLGEWFGFDAEAQSFAMLYCLTFVLPAPATAYSLFRLFGRFSIYARITILTALARLVATGLLFAMGGEFQGFLLVLCAASCLERLAPVLCCWPLLRRKFGAGVLTTPLAGLLKENERLWQFVLTSNLNVLARNSTRQFDVAALAGFLTPAQLVFYVLAKRSSTLIVRLANPIQLVVYPRMCELVVLGKSRLLLRFVLGLLVILSGLSACGLVAFALVGRPLVALAFGPEFEAAFPHILLQLVGACLFLTGTIFASALQAVRRVGQLTMVSTLTAILFFGLIPLVVPTYGALAASSLGLLVGLVRAVGCGWIFAQAIRALRKGRDDPAEV